MKEFKTHKEYKMAKKEMLENFSDLCKRKGLHSKEQIIADKEALDLLVENNNSIEKNERKFWPHYLGSWTLWIIFIIVMFPFLLGLGGFLLFNGDKK